MSRKELFSFGYEDEELLEANRSKGVSEEVELPKDPHTWLNEALGCWSLKAHPVPSPCPSKNQANGGSCAVPREAQPPGCGQDR